TTLSIKPIAITQRENGVIASNEEVPPPTELTIEGPELVEFKSGEEHLIRGRIRVPIVNSTFHSYGILVKDLGQVQDVPRSQTGDDTRIAVRYVTQYLLRCDITIQGGRAEALSQLQVDSVELVEENGLAKLVSHVFNPTDSPMSFQTRCQIFDPQGGGNNPPFFVAMPIREGNEAPEKYDIKILAKTRLRLQEFIPHPLSSGNKEVAFEFFDGRNRGGGTRVPLTVNSEEFPAQNRNLVPLADGITAEPGQLEFSMERGGNRISPLKLTNNTEKPVTLTLQALDETGLAAELLRVRPEKVTLLPGREKNILLMLSPTQEFSEHRYVRVLAEQDSMPEHSGAPVLVGLIARSGGEAVLVPGEMEWDPTGRLPAIVLPVKNVGKRHTPLNGSLTVTSVDGASMTLAAGYGRWILPGGEDQLRFRFRTIPPNGQYNIRITLDLGPEKDPVVIDRSVEFVFDSSDVSED
ncbi:MAG: hypothetical protein KDA80_08765, partial [Planctomycetaceae bacterium]|nr:hypothetical protein [Planctomycetaceae bacterium]